MFCERITALRNLVVSLVRKSAGSVVATFGLALIPITIAVGAAVDYSRANSFKTAMQAALDAAILAGAKDGTTSWTQTSLSSFNANLAAKFGSPPTPNFALDPITGIYSASVTGSQATAFLGMIKLDSIAVTVKSAAVATDNDNSCILTLDHGQPKSHVSLTLNGIPIVNLSGCSIRSNTAL